MPEFHLLRCVVALGGDAGNTVYRHRGRPIVFPELPILQNMHGEEAVTEVHVVGIWNATQDEVLQRLHVTYGEEAVKEVYPGARPRLPLSDPSIPLCNLPVHIAKPTRPDTPDPVLRPLDQFTILPSMPVAEMASPEPDTEPTPDEIAAHRQDEEDEAQTADDLGLQQPDPATIPRVTRDTHGRGSSGHARASRHAPNLPDVADHAAV